MPEPRLLPLPDTPDPDPAVLAAAREALTTGEVVAFPTETVYGLAARADDPGALERLRNAKGRPETRPFTWHLADGTELVSGCALPRLAERLARRYWPGPLTLVLRTGAGPELLRHEGWLGARVPAHRGLVALLASLDFPVAGTSANRHGEPPAVRAEELTDLGVSLVLDGGPARLGESSSVLALGPRRFELLREGLLSLADLQRTAGLRIAFVCTGNTCRSPMAQALAAAALGERLGVPPAELSRFGFAVSSAGIHGAVGSPASDHARTAMSERGLDLSGHRARMASPDTVGDLDRIYCLTASHRAALSRVLPPGRGPTLELLDPAGQDVPDPFGGSLELYRHTAAALEEAIERRVDEWVG